MSAPSPHRRSVRGRLLVIDDLPLVERLHGSLAQPVEYVANLFDAVGEIAASGAGNPVDCVILHAHTLSRPPRIVVDSLRRVDPAVRLFLVNESDSSEARAAAKEHGFDGILATPVSAAIVAEMLESDEPAVAPARAEAPAGSPLASPPDTEPAEKTMVDQRAEAPEHTPPIPVESTMEAQRAELPLPENIGDTDLVRMVIEQPDRLIEGALALMRQETGWEDLAFSREIKEPGQDQSIVSVVYEGDTLGHLSASAAESDLEPWAAWLGCWLALSRSYVELQGFAYTDPLTGAWNRRYFDETLPELLTEARANRQPITLVVFDVDDLKKYNDTYGHEAGDVVLTETVRLLQTIIRRGDRVCRIGGDEFVVVFADTEGPRQPGSPPLESVDQIARRFQTEICKMKFPKLGIDAPGSLSISAGMATFPWDGHDAESLLRIADELAIESKRRGKNALTVGPGAARLCAQLEEE